MPADVSREPGEIVDYGKIAFDPIEMVVSAIRDGIPEVVRTTVLQKLVQMVQFNSTGPDVYIGGQENPYMKRWWLIPRRKYPFNVYLHEFCRSDDDRALHDHPWWNISVLIRGSYIEHVPEDPTVLGGPTKKLLRKAGDMVYRPSGEMAHRVELFPPGDIDRLATPGGRPEGQHVWTLFITGPKERDWGFLCKNGWKAWQDFTGQNEDNGPVTDARVLGGGCGED